MPLSLHFVSNLLESFKIIELVPIKSVLLSSSSSSLGHRRFYVGAVVHIVFDEARCKGNDWGRN